VEAEKRGTIRHGVRAAGLEGLRSPFRTAEAFWVEEIIDPRDTRPLLVEWARRAHELTALDRGPRTRGARP